MKNPLIWLVLACVIIGLLIAGCIWLGYERHTYKKTSELWELNYKTCHSATKTIVTVYDSILVHDTTWIRLKGKTVFVHDTTVKWCQAFYDTVYKFSGQGRIHYSLSVKDCKAEIQFKDIVSPKEIITITEHRDTCLQKPPEYKAKLFHWGAYTDLTLNSFKTFPGIGIGGQMIINDQITIGAGGMYLNGFYGNIRIGILFKK